MRGGGCPTECRCDSHGLWLHRRPVLVRYDAQENAISKPHEYLPSHYASLERVARVHSFYPVSGERMGPSPVLGPYAASFSEFIDTKNVLPSDAERIVSIVSGGQAYQVILQDQRPTSPLYSIRVPVRLVFWKYRSSWLRKAILRSMSHTPWYISKDEIHL